MDKPQRLIAKALSDAGVQTKSILEIGCGVGGLHLTLLKRGASAAQGVDISEGMLTKAREIASEMGLSDRVRYRTGDFIATNGEIQKANIVILDKVVCCYENPEALIKKSIDKCSDLYVVSYPRNATIARFFFRSSAWIGTMLKWSFHPFYHETEMLDDLVLKGGFKEVFSANTVIWQIKMFERLK